MFIDSQETIASSVVHSISWKIKPYPTVKGLNKPSLIIFISGVDQLRDYPESRQSRIWVSLLVLRRKRRWAWWGRGRERQSGGPRWTLWAGFESQSGRRACSQGRWEASDRRTSVEKIHNFSVMETTGVSDERRMITQQNIHLQYVVCSGYCLLWLSLIMCLVVSQRLDLDPQVGRNVYWLGSRFVTFKMDPQKKKSLGNIVLIESSLLCRRWQVWIHIVPDSRMSFIRKGTLTAPMWTFHII